jgi:ubiquitin C-terminal hydrolase
MRKETYYVYLCDNGSLLTTAYMSEVPHKKRYRLYADKGYKLTKDYENFYHQVLIPENELSSWVEIKE